jgi:hypothetical protein
MFSDAESQYSVIGLPRTYSMTKYGLPRAVCPGVEHAGDAGVVHERQHLPLGLEPGDDRAGVPCPA